jgi:hypothetical protein
MADKKISALTAASTPLAGTEVLPIVQSGNTVKVSISNVTAGRDVVANSYQVNNRLKINATHIADAAAPTGNDTGLAFSSRIYPCDSAGNLTNNTLSLGSSLYQFSSIHIGDNLVIGTAGKGIDFSASGGDVLTQYDEGTWTPLDYSGAGLTLTAAGSYTRIGRVVYFSAEIIYPATANSAWAAINGLPFVRSAGAVGGAVSLLAGAGKGYTFPLLSGANGGYLYKIDDQGTHALNSDLSGQTIQISGSYTV